VLVHCDLHKENRRGVLRDVQEEEGLGIEQALAGMPSVSLPSPQR